MGLLVGPSRGRFCQLHTGYHGLPIPRPAGEALPAVGRLPNKRRGLPAGQGADRTRALIREGDCLGVTRLAQRFPPKIDLGDGRDNQAQAGASNRRGNLRIGVGAKARWER